MREYINIIKKNPIIIIFIAIELFLYLLFMCMDLYSLQHQGAPGGFLYDIALIKGLSPSMLKYYGTGYGYDNSYTDKNAGLFLITAGYNIQINTLGDTESKQTRHYDFRVQQQKII